MAFILEQFIADHSIQIGVEDVVRQMPFGNMWQKIRVGVRCAVSSCFAGVPGVGMRLGFSTGTATKNNPTDVVWVENWVGNNPGFGTSGANAYVDTNSNAYSALAIQKVGTAAQVTIGNWTATYCALSCTPGLHSMMFFDIDRGTVGAASITYRVWHMTTTQVLTDATRNAYLLALENEAAPTNLNSGSAYTQNLPLRFTKDWTHAFVGWTASSPTLNVYDFSVIRFY